MSSGLMAADVTPIVSFEDVSRVYGQVRAVDGLSLELRCGETVALLGPKHGQVNVADMRLALRGPASGVPIRGRASFLTCSRLVAYHKKQPNGCISMDGEASLRWMRCSGR
jgi:hypothetical protein